MFERGIVEARWQVMGWRWLVRNRWQTERKKEAVEEKRLDEWTDRDFHQAFQQPDGFSEER